MRLYLAVLWVVAYAVLLAWAGEFTSRKVYARMWTVGIFLTLVLSLMI